MFKNLKTETLPNGETLVSFTTSDPAMKRFIKFFRLAANEAEFFYHRTETAKRTAILAEKRNDPALREAASFDRRKLLEKFDSFEGTPQEKFHSLRRFLEAEGRPVHYDGLKNALRIAREEKEQAITEKIRGFVAQGLTYKAMAEKIGVPYSTVRNVARKGGLFVESAILEANLAKTIERLDAAGNSLPKIASDLCLPVSLVRMVAARAGLSAANEKTVSRQAAEVAILAAEGLSYNEIAKRLRMTSAQVYYHAKKQGIPLPTVKKALAASPQIAELAKRGLSSGTIACRLKLPEPTIRRHPSFRRHSEALKVRNIDMQGEAETT